MCAARLPQNSLPDSQRSTRIGFSICLTAALICIFSIRWLGIQRAMISGYAMVIDGDTLKVYTFNATHSGVMEFFAAICWCALVMLHQGLMSASQVDGIVVRLQGIDAPEREQTCRDKRARLYRCGKAQHCPTTPTSKVCWSASSAEIQPCKSYDICSKA